MEQEVFNQLALAGANRSNGGIVAVTTGQVQKAWGDARRQATRPESPVFVVADIHCAAGGLNHEGRLHDQSPTGLR